MFSVFVKLTYIPELFVAQKTLTCNIIVTKLCSLQRIVLAISYFCYMLSERIKERYFVVEIHLHTTLCDVKHLCVSQYV